MKHFVEALLAIIWVLIAIVLLWVLITVLNKGSLPFNKIFSHRYWGDRFNMSENMIQTDSNTEEFTFTENIEDLHVKLISERVEITRWDNDSIKVIITSNLPAEARPKAYISGDTLNVNRKGNWQNFGFNNWNSLVEIKIPSSLIGRGKNKISFDVSTISGSVEIKDCSGKDIEAQSTSGSVTINDCKAISMNLSSTSGSIHFEDSEALSIDIHDVSGSIHVNGKVGNILAETVSGSIKVETTDPLTGRNSFKSVSGSIKVGMPENSGYTLNYSSISGRIRNEFTGLSATKSGSDKYKDGKTLIKVETMSGSISLEKR